MAYPTILIVGRLRLTAVGLSLLFAAPVFKGGKLEDAIRTGLYVGGTLCIAGVLGPATGDMRLQFIAIVGYAGVLPAVSLLLMLLFRRSRASFLNQSSGAAGP